MRIWSRLFFCDFSYSSCVLLPIYMKPMGGRTWKYWPASGPVFFSSGNRLQTTKYYRKLGLIRYVMDFEKTQTWYKIIWLIQKPLSPCNNLSYARVVIAGIHRIRRPGLLPRKRGLGWPQFETLSHLTATITCAWYEMLEKSLCSRTGNDFITITTVSVFSKMKVLHLKGSRT